MAEYKVNARVPTVDDFHLVTGLSRKTEEAATIGLTHSPFALTVFCEDEPVGMGRVNGGHFSKVVDVAASPQHQHKGVRTLIMDALMAYLDEHTPRSAYDALVTKAEPPEAAGVSLPR